jgi:mono/diheme cytochrome c family protein
MMFKNAVRVLSVVALCGGLFMMGHAQKTVKWDAPEKAKTVKNPAAGNAASVATGKDLYAKHCRSCHGKEGLGDGPKAATLGVSCSDFSTKEFKAQTDGEIFYKITNGKDKMPAYSKTISEDADRWALVNYIRTLK